MKKARVNKETIVIFRVPNNLGTQLERLASLDKEANGSPNKAARKIVEQFFSASPQVA